jgi:hypothetical protein
MLCRVLDGVKSQKTTFCNILDRKHQKKIQNFAGALKFATVSVEVGARGSVVVKALCYKPEGRGFET